jgi:ABC-type nitrate/sulfonate/bicarbonate transport system substrate-binding protein
MIAKRTKLVKISITVLLVTVILLLFLPACQKGTSGEKELQKITVILDWVPNTNHTGIYIARENGYYDDEGLEVEIIQPSEGGSADLVAAGKGEFGISYQEQVTYARTTDNPLPIVAIAAIIQHNTSGFASPADKDIKTPADFEGKIYGGWGSPMEEAMLKGLMEKNDADYSKLEIVNIGASDFLTSIARDVDFAWIFYGWDGIKAELEDIPIDFMLLQDVDPMLDFYTPLIIASEDTIDENPGLIEKFLRATEKGYLFAIQDPEEAAQLFLQENSELDPELVTASQKYLSMQYKGDSTKWGTMDKSIWDNFSNWMFENDLLQGRLASDMAFTNEFLPH